MEMLLGLRSIYNLLEVGAAKHELINIDIRHRKLGKTHALVEFARNHHYMILVGNGTRAKLIKQEFNYDLVRSINSNFDGAECECVTEDGITREQIDQFYQKWDKFGMIITTGFVYDPSPSKLLTFAEAILYNKKSKKMIVKK
jgi:hypothetical protein